MSEIQHTSLKAELLYLIGRASTPLSGAELYERCELADEIVKVSKAIANLVSDGKIVRAPGDGRARYQLADGVAAPAPAGKTGRSKAVQEADAARTHAPCGTPPTKVPPAPGLPKLDIPGLGDHLAGLGGAAAGKTVRREPEPRPAPNEDAEVARGLDLAEKRLTGTPTEADARLADAILARLKRQLAPLTGRPVVGDVEVTTAPGAIHVHVQSVEINITVGLGA